MFKRAKFIMNKIGISQQFVRRNQEMYEQLLRNKIKDHSKEFFYQVQPHSGASSHIPYQDLLRIRAKVNNSDCRPPSLYQHKDRKKQQAHSDIFWMGKRPVTAASTAAEIHKKGEEDLEKTAEYPKPYLIQDPQPKTREQCIQADCIQERPQTRDQNTGTEKMVARNTKKRSLRLAYSLRNVPRQCCVKQALHATFYCIQVRKGWERLTADLISKLLTKGERLVRMAPYNNAVVRSQGRITVQYRRGVQQLLRRLKERGVVGVQVREE